MENKQEFAQMQFESVPVDPAGQTEGFFPGLEDTVPEPPEGFFTGEPDFAELEAAPAAAVGAAAVVEAERTLPTVAPVKKAVFDSDKIEERHQKLFGETLTPTSKANILSMMVDLGMRESDAAMIFAHTTAHNETIMMKVVAKLEEKIAALEASLEKKEKEVIDKVKKTSNDMAQQVGKRTEQTLINLIEERIDSGTFLGKAKWAFFVALGAFFFGQAVPTMRPVATIFEFLFTAFRING
ncbi:hypothetical protein [Desulfovibrio desulfuricans]|uniref:hypothetical protein n=1 Tax=Desulfovibrio desulfuricans TaxID=876 RepID=UPI001C030517|nr:hypothetical protein [Desulfovibrio desulfuricans]MBT9749208.1 hypothetical protein [Desulfovibrio desulfuricans]